MFVDRQIGKALAPFRYQCDAGTADAVWPPAGDVVAHEANAAGLDRLQPANRAQGRRLAHAVASKQGRGFALGHRQIDPEQHLTGAVSNLETGNFKQRTHRWSPR